MSSTQPLRPRRKLCGAFDGEAGIQHPGLIQRPADDLQAQWQACQATGNTLLLQDTPALRALVAQWQQAQPAAQAAALHWADAAQIAQLPLQAALAEGDTDALLPLQQQLSARSGPLLLVQGLTTEEIRNGERYRQERLLREISISTNTTAAGGNASLMMVG